MRIDSHQHFWEYNELEYRWISDEMGHLRRSFLPKDLEQSIKELNLNGCIAVQARQCLEENDFLLDLAEKSDIVKGVVGWVDLCSTSVQHQLEVYAANPYFKGVRHVLHDELDDKFMLREDFQKGIELLSMYGLTYDLLIFPKHIPYAIQLVEKFPKQKFVLDHLAKPDIKNQVIKGWAEGITTLASFENVYCKLSGMVTEADWLNWRETDFYPYLDHIFKSFSSKRVMIGSDWPVCTVSCDYQKTMNIVLRYLERFPSEIKERIMGGNCATVYNLKNNIGFIIEE
ncbi:amidohydrolase family protein [Metabacillus litoralis]|uniref:amidohydrolase family protein n=1 Tax=Metabacillus litoralis TaxID=152268 RepID=UPI002041C6B6|nr:amidohydrolase family protein [Metabacillus litoralis]MCM3410849.1 amidohydrolase family protein [Metabacillus litoralis]